MEQLIVGFVDKILVPFLNVFIPILTNGGGFVVFGVLWAAFAYALVVRQGDIDQTWEAIRTLPLIAQLLLWFLFLPVMAGLWVWETTWPLIMRIVLVVGLAGWNLMIFVPKWLTART